MVARYRLCGKGPSIPIARNALTDKAISLTSNSRWAKTVGELAEDIASSAGCSPGQVYILINSCITIPQEKLHFDGPVAFCIGSHGDLESVWVARIRHAVSMFVGLGGKQGTMVVDLCRFIARYFGLEETTVEGDEVLVSHLRHFYRDATNPYSMFYFTAIWNV